MILMKLQLCIVVMELSIIAGFSQRPKHEHEGGVEINLRTQHMLSNHRLSAVAST